MALTHRCFCPFRPVQTALCLLWVVVFACSSPRPEVPLVEEPSALKITRIDSVLRAATALSFRTEHPKLLRQFPSLYPIYVEQVMQLGKCDDSTLFTSVRRFVTNAEIAQVAATVDSVYPALNEVESQLSGAWGRYEALFAGKKTPAHTAVITGFQNSFVIADSAVAVSLEMFLGSDCRYYEMLQLPNYLRARMTPAHLAPWLVKGWLETEFIPAAPPKNLLEAMVAQGKVYYCASLLFPDVPDSVLFGYSRAQAQWAVDHLDEVWRHCVEQQLLFETSSAAINKMTADGPFTVDLVKTSAPRMGHFLGYELVRAFMAQTDALAVQKLMATPAEQILKQSRFNPS